jgi:hypothetical protein
MSVYGTDTNNTQNQVLGNFLPLSYPNYIDYKNQNDVFTDLAVFAFIPNTVSGAEAGQKPSRVNVQMASGNYFSTLGVKAALGRTFLPEDDKDPEAAPWQFWITSSGSADSAVTRR